MHMTQQKLLEEAKKVEEVKEKKTVKKSAQKEK